MTAKTITTPTHTATHTATPTAASPDRTGLRPTPRHEQRGVVLVVALIILLLVTVIGVGGVRNTALGLLISANEEQRVLAFQTAHAAVEEVTENPYQFVVLGQPGQVVKCTSIRNCSDRTLALSGAALNGVDDVTIRRAYPELGNPPRLSRAFSARAFRSTFFRVDANFDRGVHGSAEIGQGYLRLINNTNN